MSAPEPPLPAVAVSMTPQKRFEEYLQAKGQRQTPQRKLLIDEIFRQHSHFDADQLIERLPRKGQPGYVSKATVYRALREFVDASLLNCFELDGRTVYELEYGYPNHDHLYCTRCQKLVEFRDEAMIALREKTAAEHGFRVTRHRLLIHGVCRDCLKSRRTRRKQDLV